MKNYSNGISVIICCYNSSMRLPETIKYLANQVISAEIQWEVIIINNNSKDNTGEVARKEWEKYNLKINFQIYEQNIPGLKAAKEKGISVSNFDYLIFCDDDNWLSPGYVQTAFKIMSDETNAGIIGGCSEPVFETDPPDWFHEHKYGYAIGKQADSSGEIKGSVYGAGMVLRKSAWLKLHEYGFRSFLTGRQGSKLSSGEDCEMCYGIRLLNYKILYDERLAFKHFMPASRISWRGFRKMYRGFGFQNSVLFPYEYILNKNCSDNMFLLSWKKRAYDTFLWLLKNHLLFLKTLFTYNEGNKDILTTERKIGLLTGLMKRRGNYDLSFVKLQELYNLINHDYKTSKK